MIITASRTFGCLVFLLVDSDKHYIFLMVSIGAQVDSETQQHKNGDDQTEVGLSQ